MTSRTFPDGTAEDWGWDPEGNVARHVSAADSVTSYEYGPFDQLTAMRWPDGTRSEFRYDHKLQLTEVAHAGLTWRYEYDPAGMLVAETDYNGATTTYSYDPAGQLTRRVNATGQETAFRYGVLGDLIESAADGAVTTFSYDQLGWLRHARNADAEIRLDRDPVGRVIAETCNGHTMTTGYDAMGRVIRSLTPSGAEATWEYDSAGQPIAMTASGRQLRFGYDAAGQEIHRALPGGLTLTQDWDQRGRLTLQALTGPHEPVPGGPALTGQLLQRRAYSYRPDGLVIGIDDLLVGSHAIGLDRAGRVVAVTGRDWAEQYAYDKAGNISAASWPAPSSGPAASWLDSEAQGRRDLSGTLIVRAGNIRYRHDRQGRVIERQRTRISRKPDTWRYTWDADDRLTSVTTPRGSTWRYKYDPLGRRIAKEHVSSDGTVVEQTVFTWNGTVVVEQAQTATTVDHEQVITWNYRPDTFTPLTQAEHTAPRDAPQDQVDQAFYAIITDLIGTPTELTGPDGSLAGRKIQTLWGGTTWISGSGQTPLRFPGQYDDPETGMHYNNQRYYDPVTGSYLSPDPLGLVPSPNPHAYVPNPYRDIDPSGLESCLQKAHDDFPGLAHTLTEHVNVTRDEAIALAVRKGGPNSVFASKDLAQQVADHAIANSGTRIQNWLRRGGSPPLSFGGTFGSREESLGTTYYPDRSSTAAGNRWTIQLTKAKGYPGGYFISTLYPS
jgi:RHS repeat-associated protein